VVKGVLVGFVYLLRFPNGKAYIGKTKQTIRFRWYNHKVMALTARNPRPLYAAIRKYGADSVKFETLAECDDPSLLYEIEQRMIAQLKTRAPHGYNLADGGPGAVGMRHKEATKAVLAVTIAQRHREGRYRTVRMLNGVVAMRAQLERPEIEQVRRERIAATMSAKNIGVGENNGFAKLTESQVREIKLLSASGWSYAKIAARFDVSPSLVGFIKNGRRWGHVQ
jgi:group I intron endonuclease